MPLGSEDLGPALATSRRGGKAAVSSRESSVWIWLVSVQAADVTYHGGRAPLAAAPWKFLAAPAGTRLTAAFSGSTDCGVH
jgi:hypothetical protein